MHVFLAGVMIFTWSACTLSSGACHINILRTKFLHHLKSLGIEQSCFFWHHNNHSLGYPMNTLCFYCILSTFLTGTFSLILSCYIPLFFLKKKKRLLIFVYILFNFCDMSHSPSHHFCALMNCRMKNLPLGCGRKRVI